MSSKINKCMVQECKHNQGYECKAGGVNVKSQQNAMSSGVSTSSHTLCDTFAPKDSMSDETDMSLS